MEGTVVRADCVVKIHENVIETGRDESSGPFIESVGGAKGSQGDSIRMDC